MKLLLYGDRLIGHTLTSVVKYPNSPSPALPSPSSPSETSASPFCTRSSFSSSNSLRTSNHNSSCMPSKTSQCPPSHPHGPRAAKETCTHVCSFFCDADTVGLSSVGLPPSPGSPSADGQKPKDQSLCSGSDLEASQWDTQKGCICSPSCHMCSC